MIFRETPLLDAWLVQVAKHEDDRGFFGRAWCAREFAQHGLMTRFVQANVSLSRRAGTLRGLHLQLPPAAEAKLVRCTRGAIYDVIVDLRPASPTCGRWFGVNLTAEDHNMLYVPEGFAHGFQTLTDDAEVFYLVSEFYAPEHERGIRYDDPAFAIDWPAPVTTISDKDRGWPDYTPEPALSIAPVGDVAVRMDR